MVVHAYYPIGEVRVEREALALVADGYEVDVICLRAAGEPSTSVEDGVHIHRLPVMRHKGKGVMVQLLEYFAFFLLALLKVAALHSKRRYGTVQAHNLPDFLIFAGLVPKLTGSRLILDLHDLMPEFYAARFRGSMKSWPVRLLRWQEYWSCRFADRVLTVTELWRQTLIGRGVPAEKVSVVMNVANERIFHRSPASAPAWQHNGHFKLIYHGQISQRYGIDLALEAVDLLRQEIPQIELTVHGRGDYLGELQALAGTLRLGDHVRFSTHYVPTQDLPNLIASADAGVIPYRRDIFTNEILPTKLMEYTALGIPAISARTSAITAYFDDDMVQFFTPEDVQDLARCILLLHRDRSRLHQLRENSDRFNQQYNWKKVGSQYVALVNGLNRH